MNSQRRLEKLVFLNICVFAAARPSPLLKLSINCIRQALYVSAPKLSFVEGTDSELYSCQHLLVLLLKRIAVCAM